MTYLLLLVVAKEASQGQAGKCSRDNMSTSSFKIMRASRRAVLAMNMERPKKGFVTAAAKGSPRAVAAGVATTLSGMRPEQALRATVSSKLSYKRHKSTPDRVF